MDFEASDVRSHAEQFDKEIFKKNLIKYIEDKLEK
jgi:hypothetical protein